MSLLCELFSKTTIPESLIEAAKMDGASEFTIFTRIVLPLAKPSLQQLDS